MLAYYSREILKIRIEKISDKGKSGFSDQFIPEGSIIFQYNLSILPKFKLKDIDQFFN